MYSSDVSRIFDDLLEVILINLPEMKRPKEAEQREDPNYCKYHCLVRHGMQDCFVFKDKVMQLASQDFNQGGQRTTGVIRMEVLIDDIASTTLFHIIDAKISYYMLFSSPWLHENFVVPSTWHQCFKYCRNGTLENVLGDSKLFTEAASHFADAKYYIEDAKKGKDVLPSGKPNLYGDESLRKNNSSTIEVSKNLTIPLTQINMKQQSKPPLKEFVPSTQEEEGGHKALAIDEK
ncbi:UNVERIFIED_CONTAM: hypothetical protein Sangu_2462400 [Sesamum angustifolium]|uniref:Uncharacterized protein n=1 Tax=Sesamum angustifolium TaxID=2727405 RepID=A0AAW2JTH9_9LAMI